MQRPHETNDDVLVPRHRMRNLARGTERKTLFSCRDAGREISFLLRDSETMSPSRAPLEQVRFGAWKYEFKMSKLTTTILNLLFAEAEQKGRTRNFRVYIGPGSDGASADKLSLDLKFNPWGAAISFGLESHPMSKTVFTQYDPSESWCTEQQDAWPDEVKTFCHRPIRCLIVVHPIF